MNRHTLYVIEARDEQGKYIPGYPDPATVFGNAAINGITADNMAQVIFRRIPDATLSGTDIPNWPRLINPHWVARVKYW